MICLLVISEGLLAQSKSVLKIGLVFPFKAQETGLLLDEYSTKEHHKISAGSKYLEESLGLIDFYQAAVMAAEMQAAEDDIQIRLFDNYGLDSVCREIIASDELSDLDCIITPPASSQVKILSDYCLQKNIPCLIPFTPSKTLIKQNPLAYKFAPLIDAHIETLFRLAADSFSKYEFVIIREAGDKNGFAADYLSALIDSHNRSFPRAAISKVMLEPKGNLSVLLNTRLNSSSGKLVFIASFQDPFIQACLRTLSQDQKSDKYTLMGLPGWLDSEILRLDYLDQLNYHFSSAFYADTNSMDVKEFRAAFLERSGHLPGMQAYLGYDIISYALKGLKSNALVAPQTVKRPHSEGLGFQFDMQPFLEKAQQQPSFYTNPNLRVFRLRNYEIELVR